MGRKTTGAKLEREAVKRYLQQYHTAKQKKRILEERRRTLSAELRGPSTAPAFRAMPSAKPVHPDGAGALVFQIADVEERIEAQQAEMARAVQNVMDLIDLLPIGSMERTVVEMRHIDSKTWEQIAREVYLSRSAVFNYYNVALDRLARNEQSGKLLVSAPLKNVIFRRNEMSFFVGQHTSVYSLNYRPTCRLEARQVLIYQCILDLTGENDKYNYSMAVHFYSPFSYILCSAKNYKIASALTAGGF